MKLKKLFVGLIAAALAFNVGATDYFNISDNTAATISGGTIDNTVIGGTTPAAGTFTNLTANTLFRVGSGSTTNAGWIAGYFGVSGYSGLWNTSVTPSIANYSFAANSSDSNINAATNIYLRITDGVKLQVVATGLIHIGNMFYDKTITAPATTGAQTINKTTGRVNFAAAATSLVVTNSLVTTSSIIHCTVATNDTTMKSTACVAGAGSFTMYANAAATAETAVNFTVTN